MNLVSKHIHYYIKIVRFGGKPWFKLGNMLLFVKVPCLVSCAYSRHVEIDRCDSLVEVYR
jgi:hypothetical protein